MDSITQATDPLLTSTVPDRKDVVEASKLVMQLFDECVKQHIFNSDCYEAAATKVLSLSDLDKALTNPYGVKEKDWRNTVIDIAYIFSRVNVEQSKTMFLQLRKDILSQKTDQKQVLLLEHLTRLQDEIDPKEANKSLRNLVEAAISLHFNDDTYCFADERQDRMFLQIIETGSKINPYIVEPLIPYIDSEEEKVKGLIALAEGVARLDNAPLKVAKLITEAISESLSTKTPLESLAEVAKAQMSIDPSCSRGTLDYIDHQAVLRNALEHFQEEKSDDGLTLRLIDWLEEDGTSKLEKRLKKEAMEIKSSYSIMIESLRKNVIDWRSTPNRVLAKEVEILSKEDLVEAQKVLPKISKPYFLAAAMSSIACVQAKTSIKQAWKTIRKIPKQTPYIHIGNARADALQAIAFEEMKSDMPAKVPLNTIYQIFDPTIRGEATVDLVRRYVDSEKRLMQEVAETIVPTDLKKHAFSVIALDETLKNENGFHLIEERLAGIKGVFEEFGRLYALKVV